MKKSAILITAFLVLTAFAVANNETPSFSIEVEDYPEEIFIGEELDVSVEVENIGDADGEMDVEMYLQGEEVDSKEISLDENESDNFDFSYVTKSDDYDDGNELTLDFEADGDHDFNGNHEVAILKKPEFSIESFEIDPETAYTTKEDSKAEVAVITEIENEGDVEGELDLELKKGYDTVEEKTENLSGRDTEEFVFFVEIEELGTHEFTLEAEHDSESKEVEVKDSILFEGTLEDGDGNPIKADFVFEHEEGSVFETETDEDGVYSKRLEPGKYDVKIGTDEMPEISISEMEIDEENDVVARNDPVRIDFFSPDGMIGGIRPVNSYVIKSGLEYDEAEIWLRYNDTDLRGSESELEMYECEEWNFGRRDCIGEWDNRSIDVNTASNMVSFETDKLTSYTLGSSGEVILDASVPSSKEAKEEFTVSGTVEDERGNAIESARVDYEFGEEEENTFTDSSGFFEIDLVAPEEEGDYDFSVQAEKDSFVSNETSETIEIEVIEDFEISNIDDVKTEIDNSSETTFEVTNNGKLTLSSIGISVTGIPDDWYSVSPSEIINLGPGETSEAVIEIDIPEDCEDECELGHLVEIDLETDRETESTSFDLEIEEPEENLTPTGYIASASGEVFERVKGAATSINPIILAGFAALILLVGAAHFKKRRKNGTGQEFQGLSTGKKLSHVKGKQRNRSKNNIFEKNVEPEETVLEKIKKALPSRNREEKTDKGFDYTSSKSYKQSQRKSSKEMPRESIVPIFHNVKKDIDD